MATRRDGPFLACQVGGDRVPALMNFRDLGGAPVPGGVVARGRLFRTAHLSDIDDVAATRLAGELAIGVYLDFRTEAETARDGEPQRLIRRGVRWHRLPFDIADVLFKATRIPEVHDWQSLYFRAVTNFAPELAGAIRAIAEHDAPVAFGCWAGKDRTGVVAALLLSLLGVDDDWIAQDYAATASSLQPHRVRFAYLWEREPEHEAALSRAHLSTEPNTMLGLLREVRSRFGSVRDALDLPSSVLERLRARYVVPEAQTTYADSSRKPDGSAGDADYGSIGQVYRNYRVADPRIAAFVHAALGDARKVLNVGAGTGSYEPTDRLVTPVEPSATMRARRPSALPAAIDASAEQLPFEDGAFDAAMGTFTVHQWADLERGLSEVRRVTTGPIALLTCDPSLLESYWLFEYAPEVIATEAARYPALSRLAAGLGGLTQVKPVPIPFDCRDGFNDAYYGRPEMLLDPAARLACSAWSFVEPAAVARFEKRLTKDLTDGTWDQRFGHLRRQPYLEGALVLVVSTPLAQGTRN